MLRKIADGRTDLIFELIESGGAANVVGSDGVSLIQWCAYYGDVSGIRFLLSRGESLSSLGENFGLSGAAFHGHWRLCQFLIERGADVNIPIAQTGETPLHSALCRPSRSQYENVVRVLLNSGAKVNTPTLPGAPTGNFMRDSRTACETPLHRAGAFASHNTIKLLIDSGANKEAKDMHGNSPLTWASMHLRSDQIIRMLCYGDHQIHPERNFSGDFGLGETGLDFFLQGRPHFSKS